MAGRVQRWWIGFTIALLLLLPLDMLTTFVSVSKHGLGVEANPVMLWLLNRGVLELTIVHLVVIVFTVVAFHGAIRGIQRAPDSSRAQLAIGVDAWLALIVAVGVFLVTNNLLVIF